MYIHIFTTESPYSDSFLKLIVQDFDINEHLFVFNKPVAPRFNYPESIRSRIIYAGNVRKFLMTFASDFRKCDSLLFHYLPYGPSLFTWASSPGLLRKSIWIIWGGDILPGKNYRKSFLPFIFEILRRSVIRRIPRIATLIKEDYETVKKIYNTGATFEQVFYPYPIDLAALSKLKKQGSENSVKTILLGNSASPSNNHDEILEKLAPLKNSNIRIICPLSYGGPAAYVQTVAEKGNEIFGNKFITLRSFLSPADYSQLLCDTDVAVMNHDRQQGLGNIFPLLYLGKKVYLRSSTSSYIFLKNLGCDIFDTLCISKEIETLSEPGEILFENNAPIIENLISRDNCLALWKNLLSRI